MPLLGRVQSGLLRKNRYLIKTATNPVSGLGRKKRIMGVAKAKKSHSFENKSNPKIVQFMGTQKAIEKNFSESGERVIARTLAHQLQNPKSAFKVDIACAAERLYRGTKVEMHGRKYFVTVTMVNSILKKMIEKGLISEKKLNNKVV
ncbi:MAG: hypothetical protein PHY04_01645 [Candidatus ainarchaeum sp.]|jgi:hypothetical protein|nr:hypothetical protein [Candidatus ainarchaeum sp.]MDD3085622.1 hypothetical protein [Candidatus ainarchaeum sp.]MDD4128420.1 hypothetical protein [Candidatus ainarchaeum sp.]MDD4467679.1 hypothetical protein [Candidatus ainarchaeum sp.]HPM85493.1 hypothetical protein [archaeon]